MELPFGQWELQDPKMEVLNHKRPYFGGISPYIGIIYGRYLQFGVPEMAIDLVSSNMADSEIPDRNNGHFNGKIVVGTMAKN